MLIFFPIKSAKFEKVLLLSILELHSFFGWRDYEYFFNAKGIMSISIIFSNI